MRNEERGGEPRAARLEVAADGYFAVDDHGNTVGGVRFAQLDVPHSAYQANPLTHRTASRVR